MDKRITLFIAGLVVIVAGIFAVNSFLKKSATVQAPVAEEPLPPEIVVPNQAGGMKLFIERATLPAGGPASPSQGGYVVIHKDADGAPGAITGSSRLLSPGSTLSFLVDTEDAVETGDTLYAMLHADNGDGSFSAADDGPIMGGDGMPVMVKFLILDQGALENEVKL